MLFSLVVLAIILGITLFNSVHGFYSAFIMLVITLVSAAVAVGTFEYVAENYVAEWWNGDYAYPVALAAIFGLCVAVTRVIFDQLISHSNLLPAIVDYVGSGACGLVIGLTIGGMFTLCVDMIPFERGNVMGFQKIPYNKPELDDPNQEINPVPADPDDTTEFFLTPDRFALAAGRLLADQVFSKGGSFAQDHPDFVSHMSWVNSVPMEVQRYAAPGSIEVTDAREIPVVHKLAGIQNRGLVNWEDVPPGSGKKYIAATVVISDKAKRQHTDNYFSLRQFRIVGSRGPGGPLQQTFAIAYQDPGKPGRYALTYQMQYGQWPTVDLVYSLPFDQKGKVEVAFEVDRDFVPRYIEYKIGARAVVPWNANDSRNTSATTRGGNAPKVTSDPAPPNSDTRVDSSGNRDGMVPSTEKGGNVRGFTTRVGESFFGPSLPITLRDYKEVRDLDLQGSAMVRGHIWAYPAEQPSSGSRTISSFFVPEDMRLLQLNVGKLQARSGIGRVLSQAVQTIQNYTVQDENGKLYQVVGKYVVVMQANTEVVEIQYFSDQVGSMGGIGKFSKVADRDITEDSEFVLLFLVDPGVRIVKFSTGGAASRADDLTGENLVAPN